MNEVLILLTNDDGVDSPGLLALRTAMASVGEVAIIAPERNWSAVGHTKTLNSPLRVREVTLADGSLALSTDGTPSDCVTLGVLGLLSRKPDLVVAGVNYGANLGDDITYSGTVAAAMEGVVSGIPSIAVSQNASDLWHFDTAAEFAAALAKRVLAKGLSGEILLNVNVPNLPKAEIKGVEVTRLGKRIYRDVLVERKDPRGRSYYWIGGEAPSGQADQGTDLGAIAEDKISVTPIHLDLTNHRLLEKIRGWHLGQIIGE